MQRQREARQKAEDARLRSAELEACLAQIAAFPELPRAAVDDDFQTTLEAVIAKYERQLEAQTATTRERLRKGRLAMDRFFATADRVAEQDAADAETAVQHVLERLRSRDLSRNQLGVLARVIAAQLGHAERAIEEATAAVESAALEVEAWIHRVSVAVDEQRDDLAEPARGRVEQWRSTVSETQAALREYVELRDRLRDLGRVVLEVAAASPPLSPPARAQ